MNDPNAPAPAATLTRGPAPWRPAGLAVATTLLLGGVSLVVPPRDDVPVWVVPIAGGVLVGLRTWLRARNVHPRGPDMT